ncbi:hypothetical protein R4Y59_002751, partial [Enterococcus faecalis]|nr:hypothetical protein [Enterococcus faecalis]
QIRELSLLLEKGEQEKRLDKLNIETFEKYRIQDFALKKIAELFGVSVSTLNKWRLKQKKILILFSFKNQ